TFDGLVGGTSTITGVNQFSYTADFGQGMTLSVSAQDPTAYFQAGVNNISAGGAYGASDYAGTIVPDFIASLRVDQAW
ncbi:porin, partial [Escherichia coli]|nr:porin [Escherichia coli]